MTTGAAEFCIQACGAEHQHVVERRFPFYIHTSFELASMSLAKAKTRAALSRGS